MKKSTDRIQICITISDPRGQYCKYAGTMMESVFRNTQSRVCFHIICDDTVRKIDLDRFKDLAEKHNQSVEIHIIDPSEWKFNFSILERLTIGTMFRLKIPELLGQIDKLIYLDCDLLVQMDIKELWDIDISEYYVAACHDELLLNRHFDMFLIRMNLVSENDYYNSGVMLLNLDRIRKMERPLFDMCISYLSDAKQIDSPDQDSLNYVFRNHVMYIDGKFNRAIAIMREHDEHMTEGIYHFMADSINYEKMQSYDELFMDYYLDTPWGVGKALKTIITNHLSERTDMMLAFQAFIKCMTESKKIMIFGATSPLVDEFESFFSIKNCNCFLDNYEWKNNSVIRGVPLYSPEEIKGEDPESIFVIILSNKHTKDISDQLESYGLKKNSNYIDGRLLLLQNQGGYLAFQG